MFGMFLYYPQNFPWKGCHFVKIECLVLSEALQPLQLYAASISLTRSFRIVGEALSARDFHLWQLWIGFFCYVRHYPKQSINPVPAFHVQF